MMTPTIHSNGTSRKDLEDQIRDAHRAAHELLEKLQAMMPHGRDYYPQGESAALKARSEHRARMIQVQTLKDELEAGYHTMRKAGR